MGRSRGFNVNLRRANSSGVGSMVPVVQPKGRVNTGVCPVCGAKRGERCFFMTATRFVELKETHTGRSARQGDVKPRPTARQTEEKPVGRNSNASLGGLYDKRGRAQSNKRKNLNGG